MVTRHEPGEPTRVTHSFMLRLWPEDLGGGQTDWRGSVQHVNSGEARYFRDWPTLQAFVEGLLGGRVPDAVRDGRASETGRPPLKA